MLLFGLAWVASWISPSFSPVIATETWGLQAKTAVDSSVNHFSPHLYEVTDERGVQVIQRTNPFPTRLSLGAETSRFQLTSSLSGLAFQQQTFPFQASASTSSFQPSHKASAAAPSLAFSGAVMPTASFVFNWLESQNSALDWAEPITRWLSAISPLKALESTPSTVVPPEILSKEHLVCLSTDSPETEPAQYEDFSTWLRGCILGGLSDQKAAGSLATRIEETLIGANWQSSAIEPTIVENLPAAKIGDRTLFVVTEEISYDLGLNAEVITTQWVNQLRLALGSAALPLVESQMKMYGLKPTGDFLSGEASWYGPYFQGRLTATGEIFDKAMFTAAHKTLPFDTFLKITNLHTGNVLVVRINDRGPYVGDRILDLSQGSAQYLGSPEIGVIAVTAEFLEQENQLQASLPYRAVQPSQDPLITMWRP